MTSISHQTFHRRRTKELIMAGIFLLIWGALALFLLTHGDKNHGLHEVVSVLLGAQIKGVNYAVKVIRLPRVIIGTLAGFAFGASGNTFQKIMRNPLASPDVLGISSGASLFAVTSMLVLGLSGAMVSGAALAGGLLTAFLIIQLSRARPFSVNRMILIGIGLQAMALALINYVLLRTADYDVSSALHWLSGSLNGVRMSDVPLFAIVVCIFSILLIVKERDIKILELGEELPVTLGMKPGMQRALCLAAAVILCAASVSVTGPLSSVAFMAGPIAHRLVKTGNVGTFAAGMTGAVITLLAESIGQFAFATRYPVGVMTGLIGAPYLIWLLIKMNQKS